MSISFQMLKLSALTCAVLACSQVGHSEPSHQLQTCFTLQTNGEEKLLTKDGPEAQPNSVYHLYATVSPNDDLFVVAFDQKGQILKDTLPQFAHVSSQNNFIKLNLPANKIAKKTKFFVVAMPSGSSQSKELQKQLEKKNYASLNSAQSKALYNRLIHWNEATVGHGGPTVEQLGASRSTVAHTSNPRPLRKAEGNLADQQASFEKAIPSSAGGVGRVFTPQFDWKAKAKKQSYGVKQPKTFIFEIKQ